MRRRNETRTIARSSDETGAMNADTVQSRNIRNCSQISLNFSSELEMVIQWDFGIVPWVELYAAQNRYNN